jgi:CheY-like chemotaxis protein
MNSNKKRVLIVDDDEKSRQIFRIYMTSLGFDTFLVHDGEEALEILTGDPYFDLIITDVMMPYSTGFDFTKKLKEYRETKDIPVIGTSAFHDWKKAREEREFLVDGFVPKPVERRALLKEIDKIFKK